MAKSFPNTGATTGLSTDRTGMTGMFAGQQFFETDTNRTYYYNGTIWVPSSPILAEANRTTNVNLSVFGEALPFNAVIYDPDSIYNSTNRTFTAPVSGYYWAWCVFAVTNTSGYTATPSGRIVTNYISSSVKYSAFLPPVGTALSVGTVATHVPLNAGNTVSYTIDYGSGGTVGWSSQSRGGIRWVAPL